MKQLALTIGGPNTTPISILAPSGVPTGGPNALSGLLGIGITIMLIAAVVISLIFLILGGIRFITSGGDAKGMDAARKQIIFAVVGLGLAFFSFFIVKVIGAVFGVEILTLPF